MSISVPIEPLTPEQRLEPTHELISQLEALLSLRLPDNYRRFLTDHGGTLLGDLGHDVVIPFLHLSPLGKIAYPEVILGFYSKQGDPYDVRNAAAKYIGSIPRQMIPFAYALGDDPIILSCDGEDAGKVYLWDHKHSLRGEYSSLDHRGLYLLARSFDEFLSKLATAPEGGELDNQ